MYITEDSPGTVDALAKGSAYHDGFYIEGGVDLGVQGQYILDPTAARALARAMSATPVRHDSKTSELAAGEIRLPIAEPCSFDFDQRSYSVVPQHSLTSGRDLHGIRYQTDLALRSGNQPGLELVRYYDPRRNEGGAFGDGWHLLIPYRIFPAGEKTRPFLNAIIPAKMVVKNLLTGEEEGLTFSEDCYSIAGYVPEKVGASQVVGLFLMSDASYRLADKLGNQFWFDPSGHLTDMVFSEDYHVGIQFSTA